MDDEARQLLLTSAWLFARHGQKGRARVLLEALSEENPKDGVVGAVLAQLLLDEGKAEDALRVLRAAEFPDDLGRAEALLEARALKALGRDDEAAARWSRYVKARMGGSREWVAG